MQYKTFINIEHAGLILKVELNSHFNFTSISFLFSKSNRKDDPWPVNESRSESFNELFNEFFASRSKERTIFEQVCRFHEYIYGY